MRSLRCNVALWLHNWQPVLENLASFAPAGASAGIAFRGNGAAVQRLYTPLARFPLTLAASAPAAPALLRHHPAAAPYRHAPGPCMLQQRHAGTGAEPSKPTGEKQPEAPGSSSHGWRFAEVFTVANNISLARLLSGPLIAQWIVDSEWAWALGGLALAGISDWADGYAAARWKQQSVLGSYLDPLADKCLIACVIGALGWRGILSPPVVAVIVSRDVLLVLGGFYHRAAMLKWRVSSVQEFFRVVPGAGSQSAPRIKPIFISKVNTVLQLAVVGACVSNELVGWPQSGVLDGLVAATLATTLVSGMQYVLLYRAGKLL